MKTDETRNTQPTQPTGVQRDSETPLPQKPSVLYISSIILGIIVIVSLAAWAYYGVAQ